MLLRKWLKKCTQEIYKPEIACIFIKLPVEESNRQGAAVCYSGLAEHSVGDVRRKIE
jgi:hypothetical protein